MKVLLGSTLLAVMVMGSHAFAQGTLDLAGTWLTEDGRAKIRTEHCGEGGQKLCGYVVWMKSAVDDKGQPRLDIKNPDPAKRGRPSLGLELMSGLIPDDPTHYSGEIYNAEDGKMYSVTVSSEDPASLKVHGCLLHILCGSQTWERVADVALPTTKVVATGTIPAVVGKTKPAAAAGAAHTTVPAK